MGLFPSANDFKAGKGVEKDAPRKTGIGRFFELVGRDMNGMFLANLLTCIGFAPVICLVYIGFLQNSLPVMLGSAAVGGLLAGPALAGMYDTVLRALRDEGYVTLSPASGDRREKNASLTPAGQTYARALLEPLYALEDAVFARMGDARVQEMMDAIALFNMIFEKETEMIK